jgi:hypothetical protein
MPAPSQIGRTTAEYAGGGGLGADDLNRFAAGYDLGPDEASIILNVVNAVNDRRVRSAADIRSGGTNKRSVKVTQGAREYVVNWYQNTVFVGPLRFAFDLGSENEVLRLAQSIGGSWNTMVALLKEQANDWSKTNLSRANSLIRMAKQAFALWSSRAAAGYRLSQQTGRADERAAELEAERQEQTRRTQQRVKAFVRNPTSLDGAAAGRMLDQAQTMNPQIADRLLAKVSRITEEAPETSSADAVEAAGAELAAEDSSVLDVLYPLATPEFYQQDLQSLPVEWALLFAAFVVPGTSFDVDLPDVTVFDASWPTVGRAWQNLLMHILYGSTSS